MSVEDGAAFEAGYGTERKLSPDAMNEHCCFMSRKNVTEGVKWWLVFSYERLISVSLKSPGALK